MRSTTWRLSAVDKTSVALEAGVAQKPTRDHHDHCWFFCLPSKSDFSALKICICGFEKTIANVSSTDTLFWTGPTLAGSKCLVGTRSTIIGLLYRVFSTAGRGLLSCSCGEWTGVVMFGISIVTKPSRWPPFLTSSFVAENQASRSQVLTVSLSLFSKQLSAKQAMGVSWSYILIFSFGSAPLTNSVEIKSTSMLVISRSAW